MAPDDNGPARVAWPRIRLGGRDRLGTAGELALAARISGVAWLAFAASLLLMLAVPGADAGNPALAGPLVVLATAWAAVLLGPAARRWASRRVLSVSGVCALVAIAAAEPMTAGAVSPVREFLWFAIVYAALFLAPAHVAAAWLGCCVVHALPLLYDAGAVEQNLVRELTVVVPGYAIVALLVLSARQLIAGMSRETAGLEAEQRRLADERASLRRVAAAVAAGPPPQAIFTLVSSEAGRLLGADGAGILRFLGDNRLEVMGNWTPGGEARTEPGQILETTAADELVLRGDGAPVRIDRYGPDDRTTAHALGYEAFVGAPVHVGAGLWGVLCAAARRPGAFPPGSEARLQDYAELIATAIANAEDRARLGAQAAVDPLTELPNERAFRERLDAEITRARRHGRPLTVAVADVDHFRDLTEQVGPEDAARTLAEIAGLLRSAVREEDVVARLGADAFAVAFVESDRADALRAAEEARRLVATTPLRHGVQLSVSIGLADLASSPSDDELLRRADAALLLSKEHGRDRCTFYDAAIAHAGARRTAHSEVERERGLAGLRALARAVDAKHPATKEHSERVAALAARLAGARDWPEERIERLREAAILHDVGKIGVPDGVLLKPGPLDAGEAALMREHVALGARIVGDVLDERQVQWIAAHHERPDGSGYPCGIAADEIPEGAALLALADAWDSMVSERIYSPRRSVPAVLAECRSLAGRQFTLEAVAALEALHARGDLAGAAARLHRPTPTPAGRRAA